MSPHKNEAPPGVNIDLDLSHFLPEQGVAFDEGLLIIEDVRRVGQVADGLEAAARSLRAILVTP